MDEEEKTMDSAAEEEVAELRRQLEAKIIEAKETHERLLRQAADLENYKKRSAREKADAIRYGNEGLAKDLLPVIDNLERALDYAKGGGNGKPLLEGIEMVLKSFLEILGKHGITQISAIGDVFDPTKHEAIAQIESREHAPNTVVADHQKGYRLLERLLRPTQVTVARPPENKDEKKRSGG